MVVLVIGFAIKIAMYAKPTLGSRVRVTVSWHDSITALANRTTERTYTGTVVENKPWEDTNTISLFTGMSYHPVSNIALERVVDLVYVDSDQQPEIITVAQAAEVPLPDEQWTVTGSRGDQYQVVRRGNLYSCQCKGYYYRGTCGHIKEIQIINS